MTPDCVPLEGQDRGGQRERLGQVGRDGQEAGNQATRLSARKRNREPAEAADDRTQRGEQSPKLGRGA
jgi:hypothetical protein